MAFKKAMRAERIKFHRSPVLLAFVVLTLLSAALGTVNYMGNLGILKKGWYDLWSQHTLFACSAFLPAELGVLCAWQWRLEHTDHCWNGLMTAPLPFWALYLAKLCWAVLISIAAMAFTAACYLICGRIAGLPLDGLPPELWSWLLSGLLGCIVVCAWQELFAMLIRAFAVPVAGALIGGFSGLYLMAKGWGLFWPWALLSLGMRANSPERILDVPPFLASCILFTFIPTILAAVVAARRDVRSE